MKTMVAVAPEPKPIDHEDFLAFMELVIPSMSDSEFMEMYRNYKSRNWRKGQFFLRCLPAEYKRILAGSLVDPYHKDDWDDVYKALEYLLDRI